MIPSPLRHLLRLMLLAACFLPCRLAHAYDPLAVTSSSKPQILDLSFHDGTRNRDIPLRFYLPESTASAPVVLFSHGLGGDRTGSAYMGKHWAARGFVVLYVQHPGSDDAVWRGFSVPEQDERLRKAASKKNFLLRAQDIHTVLDQLAIWNQDKDSPLFGRLDLTKIGMSGHSFGAITTEAVSGESFPFLGQKFTDPRIRAAIAFSPALPGVHNAQQALAKVRIPWMLMTGTKDTSPIGHTDAAARLALYPALHGVPKYEVVLFNAEHSAFTDRSLRGDQEPRNPNHHRVILALSTAFWEATLQENKAALRWLTDNNPGAVLEKQDQYFFFLP